MIREVIRELVREKAGDANTVAIEFRQWLAGSEERIDAFLDEMEGAAGPTPLLDAIAGEAIDIAPEEESRASVIAEQLDARENPGRLRDLKAEVKRTYYRAVDAIIAQEVASYRERGGF